MNHNLSNWVFQLVEASYPRWLQPSRVATKFFEAVGLLPIGTTKQP